MNYVQVIKKDITVTLTHSFSFLRAALNATTLQLLRSLFSVRLDVLTTRTKNYPGSSLIVVTVVGEKVKSSWLLPVA